MIEPCMNLLFFQFLYIPRVAVNMHHRDREAGEKAHGRKLFLWAPKYTKWGCVTLAAVMRVMKLRCLNRGTGYDPIELRGKGHGVVVSSWWAAFNWRDISTCWTLAWPSSSTVLHPLSLWQTIYLAGHTHESCAFKSCIWIFCRLQSVLGVGMW